MPYLFKAPVASTSTVETLKAAVARWDGEGGAGVHGPQEGYGVGRTDSNPIDPIVAVVASTGHELQLVRLVRLLFAASSIRNETLASGTPTTPGTLRLGAAGRPKIDAEKVSRVLTRMTRDRPLHATRTGRPA